VPLARDALEFVGSAVVELDPRACHEVLDSARNEYLARLSLSGDACADVDG
jgi:hypothetical protein